MRLTQIQTKKFIEQEHIPFLLTSLAELYTYHWPPRPQQVHFQEIGSLK